MVAKENVNYIVGYNEMDGRKIPVVSTRLDCSDKIGAVKVRLALSRMDYSVAPGLYCVGSPAKESPVFVTANYKLTFDALRSELSGIDCWILALDTKGVNVWCAAGKGTFGTEELIDRINIVKLHDVVSHRKLILPQLGAVGVAAHLVRQATGFSVHYGPVRAADIPKYIASGFKKDDEMRRVTFTMSERLTVVPVELVMAWRFIAGVIAFCFAINAFAGNAFRRKFIRDAVTALGGIFTGLVAVPAFLPYIPGRAFSVKGFFAAAAWLLSAGVGFGFSAREWIANSLVVAPMTSFLALNFTGATTYTSQSGVTFEIKKAMKAMKYSFILGIVLKIVSKFGKD